MTTTRDSEEVPSVIYPDFTIVCFLLALVCFELPPKFLVTQMRRVHDESHPESSQKDYVKRPGETQSVPTSFSFDRTAQPLALLFA